MIKVGEASGEIDNILLTLTTYYEKSKKYEEEIRNALIYPTTVFVLLLASILIISTFLLPTYTKIFTSMKVDMPKILITFTNASIFVKNFFVQLILFIVVVIFLMKKFINSDKGKIAIDYIKIKFPIIKIVSLKTINYRFAQSMSILYSSGVPIIESLEITNDLINNHFISIEITEIIKNIADGNKLSDSIQYSKYFSNNLVSLLKVGEHSGFLSESLYTSAGYLESELDSLVHKLNKFVEPIINLVLGLIIFFLMLMVILPSLSLGFEIL